MAVIDGSSEDLLTPLLVCPGCKSDLDHETGFYECRVCDGHYKVVGNTPYFSEAQQDYENEAADIAFRKRYEWQYHDEKDAREYDESFRSSARKRQRTRRELDIVSQFLDNQPRSRTLLDIPCGGGRLSAPMAGATKCLIEGDISPAQLQLALGQSTGNQRGMVISALDLPFAPCSIDGVVCARLSHHLPNAGERGKLLAELLRVASRFVIFSFTDLKSIQSLGRKIRGRALNPCAMAVAEIEQICATNGGQIAKLKTVSYIGPRHRFALVTKTR